MLRSVIIITFILTCFALLTTVDQQVIPDEENGKGLLDFFFGVRPRYCKCTCGRAVVAAGAAPAESKIIGGHYINAHEYPWLVVINIQGITIATGTLINDRYVLTSASQALGLTPYDVKITLGAFDRCHPGLTSSNFSINSILLHPEFNPLTRSNDLALLRLAKPVTMERWISPICLSKPDSSNEGKTVETVGWGEGPTAEGAQLTSCLPRKVQYPVLSSQDCLRRVADVGIVTSDKDCMATSSSHTSICSTDTGGPVQMRASDGYYELTGILPDTNICSSNSSGVSVFTRTNVHYTWLFENTKDACFCSK